MSESEAVARCVREASGFAYLASVFMELPDSALVRGIRTLASSLVPSDADEATHLMYLYAYAVAEKNDEEVLRELGVDRAKLVRHVDATCIAPPYESLYVSASEDIVLRQINRFVEEEGFAPVKDVHMPNDYLGMELSFMQFTLEEQTKALEQGNEERARHLQDVRERFWNEHLSKWVQKYGVQMKAAAQTEYYRAVGMLLSELALSA